jgi:hypothetical protein
VHALSDFNRGCLNGVLMGEIPQRKIHAKRMEVNLVSRGDVPFGKELLILTKKFVAHGI